MAALEAAVTGLAANMGAVLLPTLRTIARELADVIEALRQIEPPEPL
jgi:hypothetical protein